MELRLDRLLAELRQSPAEILGAIDADPLLIKRESAGLVLANASQTLYTPQHQHQLYAKGIVYRRNPYRLVSLPLIKIYNVGERDVTVADLAELGRASDVHIRFLRKVDGSLIQVFRADGRVWFTTRGMIEGARWRFDPEDEDPVADFDYLAEARALAVARYPRLLDDPAGLEGRTLLFEFIHPRARHVTNYGEQAHLIFLAAFDHGRVAYLPYPAVVDLGRRYDLNVVDALSPGGEGLAEQIEDLLASLAGTDQEGSVVQFERHGEVIYRVKVKSPDYLRLMQLMTACTYERTVEMVETNPHLADWPDLERHLKELGREQVPEEVLGVYRAHYERYRAYLGDLDRLGSWARQMSAAIEADLGGRAGYDTGSFRKAYAARVVGRPLSALLFAALDGRLDRDRLRRLIRTPEEAAEALAGRYEAGSSG
jgi:hypothetical protein